MTTPPPSPSVTVITALVVEPHVSDRLNAAAALAGAGFQVTATDNFASAKERMAAKPPNILVTEVCLAEFNGLHLVIRGRYANPKMVAIVTCGHDDAFLREEAERMGATFVVKPANSASLLASVLRTMFRVAGDGTPVRPPFERRTSERRAQTGSIDHPDRRLTDRRRPLSELLPATLN